MSKWTIEQLGRDHLRDTFDCGKPPLNVFLRTLVSQYEKRDLGRTYVACPTGEKRVVGYYTIASGAIAYDALPAKGSAKLPKHPVPVVLIARLAVDHSVHGQGLGGWLLRDALNRCVDLADALGIHAVAVEAIDPEAKAFYERYGFIPQLDSGLHLFLPVATIRAASKTS